ncbi:DUF4395 domain-containing protein [Spongiactinospora sp. TRM90649]|uniref:DUF4395 domain-containing protein n=1 Tax=Spongiactinospora sp. TRM90649 TaxID=3031114 RepID=UPI0023FA3181|nr:DUF4395 domain-containing protein [Spongiactinospora sp. TRM90649]MDF5751784.1 DUF4395 domain-containing protein [Spongiactinospora sp. TRM90649]
MQVDPRTTRFSAAITTLVLSIVLVTDGAWLLGLQAVLFALGVAGVSPYRPIFRRLVKSPPAELEDAGPPRFAQAVGLVFATVGLVGYVAQITPLAIGATAAALFAAFLNAAFGFCLGCEIYLIIRRLTPATR